MELIRMKLADLRANPMNARHNFEGIEELADRLELTPGSPGEPLIPIVAVRDANVARIVDGERRFRAMNSRGKVDECWVFLCDDMDEAAQAIAMLVSNDREQLSEEDFGYAVQQAFILGVPEEKIDKLAGQKAYRATKRVVEANKGKARQISVEQMLAAEEVIDAGGTEEDYNVVLNDDLYILKRNSIIRKINEERDAAELEEAIAEVVAEHGLVVADKKPKGAILRETLYLFSVDKVRVEGPTWAASKAILVRPAKEWSSWELYDEPKKLSAREQEVVDSKNKLRRIRSAGEKRRAEWIYEKLLLGGGGMPGLPRTQKIIENYFSSREYDFNEFNIKAGIEKNEVPIVATAWMCIYAWPMIDHMKNDDCDALVDGDVNNYYKSSVVKHLKIMNALVYDGYEPTEDETIFTKRCRMLVPDWTKEK